MLLATVILTEAERRAIVEQELTRRLYNHTAVALHDWQASVRMAALAKQRLDLDIRAPDLPGSDIDPGCAPHSLCVSLDPTDLAEYNPCASALSFESQTSFPYQCIPPAPSRAPKQTSGDLVVSSLLLLYF